MTYDEQIDKLSEEVAKLCDRATLREADKLIDSIEERLFNIKYDLRTKLKNVESLILKMHEWEDANLSDPTRW